MIAVVIKSIGQDRKPGDLVDTTGWRNVDQMIRFRQIRAAAASEVTLFEKGVRTVNAPAAKAKTAKAAAAA